MHFLVISTPRAEKPSAARENQKAWWDWLDPLVKNGTAPGYPDVYNTAFADVYNNFIVPKMVQRVVIDGWEADRVMDEAQTLAQSIYDKYM